MRLAWLVVVGGCWAKDPKPQPAPTPEAPPAQVERDPFPFRSKWRGTYQCSQGQTAVVLTLDAKPDGSLTAVFEFGPTEENPSIPEGAYRLRGIIRAGKEGTFDISLDPDTWIHAPDGYIMVPMSATSSRKWQRLVGRINHPTCGALDVRRTDE